MWQQRCRVCGNSRPGHACDLEGGHRGVIAVERTQFVELACELEQVNATDEARDAFIRILDELKAEGINPGDRRITKAPKACRAFAYLSGADVVESWHLEVLADVLWVDPDQAKKCAQIVAKIANPIGSMVNEQRDQIADVLAKCTPSEAVPKLKEIQKKLSNMPQHPKRDLMLRYAAEEIKRQYDKVVGEV